ncbi:MAG TPA: trimethylamine methyltransferase family protein [Thermoanaerobaculaceae bacterium]|nr:trimethylamine methyltransferase family protein [Thermoanaerobaculaceae bacterium]
MDAMRPRLEMFTPEQAEGVVTDAIAVLGSVGFEVENARAQGLLRGAGVRERGGRFFATEQAVRSAVAGAPSRVAVYDRGGVLALDLGGDRVHFDPGSAAIHFLDPGTNRRRPPLTADLRHIAWVTQACRNIAAQSTALVPSDVPEMMGDRWRLYVALVESTKPVVTGTFRKDAFAVMRAMLAAVRGGDGALAEKPLAIFDCCPSPPLKWSDLTCEALLDCADAGVPAELVSMPLGGATSPVTLREMVVQHTAESLSGVLLHQLARPGAPIVWGGSPAAFDMRHGTTPMGAIETMMVDAGDAQIGKHLGLPTHAYMGMSDAKVVDWQTGMESGVGAVLGALAGVNLISGPGMLDFESCQSLEKLILDDQVAGMALRLAAGISHGSAARAVDLIRSVVEIGSFLGHRHTRENFRKELFIPGKVIERGTYDAWEAAGARDAAAVAAEEVRRIVALGNPAPLPSDVRVQLDGLIAAEARRLGVAALPPVA